MVSFLIGMLVGSFSILLLICLLSINSKNEEYEELNRVIGDLKSENTYLKKQLGK